MNCRLFTAASLTVALLAACGSAGPAADETGAAALEAAADRAPGFDDIVSAATPLPQPSTAGNGLAVKSVCQGNTGAGGTCNNNPNNLSTIAMAVSALNTPAPTAIPPVAAQVLSFVVADPVGWTDEQAGDGIFSTDIDMRLWFGGETYQSPYSFAGYIAIPASTTDTTKSFAVGSDDGFMLSVSNGSSVYKYTNDGPRSFGTGGTPSLVTGTTAPPSSTALTVTFPHAATGMLYPIELIFYEQQGMEVVELSWADGTKVAPTTAAKVTSLGYTLIPAASLYAPDVRATLYAQDTDSAAGSIAVGTHLTYTSKLTNLGTVAANNLTYTVMLPSTVTYAAQTNPAGCTNTSAGGGVTQFQCTAISLAVGATQTIAFNAVVGSGAGPSIDGGTNPVDVQGIVQGLATTTDVQSVGGDTAQIYVYSDDPTAGTPLTTMDTANAPSALVGTSGLVDDDPTRFTVGQPLPQPPAITSPSAPVSALSRVTVGGTSSYPVGTTVKVTMVSSSTTKTCTATVTTGGAWSCASITLPDGSYSSTAAVVNGAGMTGPSSTPYTITVTAPPAPVITTPAAGAVIRNSQVFLAGTANVPAGSSITVTVIDSTNTAHVCTANVQSDQSWVCAETLPDGGYSWSAAVNEAAGTFGPATATQTFTVNTAGLPAPTIQQTSSPTRQNKPALSGTASAGDSGPAYTLDVYDGNTIVCSVTPVPASWSCTPATALADGVHLLTAVIFDGGGNSSPASNADAFTVDTTAPAAPTVVQLTTPTSNSKPTFSGTGEPGAALVLTDSSGNVICSATVLANGDWSCTPAAALNNATYTVSAKQTDAAGNVSVASSTMTFTVDTSAPGTPVITPPTSPTNDNTVPLTGTADVGTTLTVRDQAGQVVCTATVLSNGKWSCTTSALPDGTDTLTATSTDAAGNSTNSASVNVTVDTIAPAAPVLKQNASPTANTTPTFSGSAETGTTVSVSINGAVVCTAVAVSGAFSCSASASSPLPSGSYTATATSKDKAGNVSAQSNGDSFTINTTVPVAPSIANLPTPLGGQPNTTSQTQPTFNGNGTPGDLVSVEVQPGGAILCSAIVASDGTWSCTTQANEALNGSPAEQVTVKAVQESSAGVTGPASGSMTFTVATGTPTTPVLAPLPANIATNTPPISGSADAGSTVTVRDESGRVICTATTDSNGDWACDPQQQLPLAEGSNTLTATSVGPSGLSSAPSNPVTTNVDTMPPLPPVLTQTASPTSNTLPVFTGSAEPGSTVNIYDGSSTTPIATCTASTLDGSFSCPTNASTPLSGAPATQTVTATATDAAGNVSAVSNTDTFVVDTTKPNPPVLSPLPTPAGATPGNTDDTQPTFSGTGIPGDTVTVQSTSPATGPLCTATVKADGTWSCQASTPLTGDPATSYTFTATQTTPAGVTSDPSSPQQTTVSTVIPTTPTLVVPSTPSSSQNVPVSGTGTVGETVAVIDPTGQVLCTAVVQADGTWSCTTTSLPEGNTTVVAVGVSNSGTPSTPSGSGTITVLTFGPLAPTLQQNASPTNTNTPTFIGKAQPDSTVIVSAGSSSSSSAASSSGTVLCTATADVDGNFSCTSQVGLPDGLTTVTATATDAAGNVSPPSLVDSFIIDTSTPPAPVISQSPAVSGGLPGVTSNPYPVIMGTGVAGDTVTVTSNGQTLCMALVNPDGSWACTSAVSLSGNPATTYPLSATQTSPAGNTSPPGTQSLTVDTTATAAPTLDQPVSPTRDRQPTFTGTGVPGDTIQVYSGATVLCSATATSGGTWSCVPTTPLADGSYLLLAVQLGASGTASGTSTLRTLVVDNASLAAPTFDQPATPTENNEPALSGTAEAAATVTVTDAMTSAVICSAVANNAGIWSCKPVTPLSAGTHTFVATATDSAGNTSPASVQRTMVVTSPDGMPHVAITSPSTGAQLTDMRPAITGTSTSGTTVTVTIDGASFQAQTAADGTWTLTPTTDLSAGTHTVTAIATDAAGQISAPASTSFQILQTFLARGGCASGGVPSPVLALLALLVLFRSRRASRKAGSRSAEAASAARSSLRRGLIPSAVAAMVAIATIPSAARAQSDFDLETFRPAAGGDGYAGVEGARPPIDNDKEGKIDVKLWLDGTNKPLTVIEQDGSTHALVRQRYDGWLSAQFHLNGPLSLSAQIPFLLAQHGDLSFLPPAARGPSSFSASIGDIRLTPRVSLLRQETVGVDLAAQISLELPTGQTDSLSTDDRVTGSGLVALAHRFYLDGPGSIEILGNVYANLRPPREILDVKVGSTAGIRGALGYYFGDTRMYVPQRVYGELDGQSYLRAGFTSGSAPAEWRVGGTWCVSHGFAIDAAVGTGIGNGVGAPSARGLLGFGYSPASCRQPDRDGDGVPDRDDKCIDVPGLPERQGCPAPPDRDHDGVPDSEDACPDEPGLKENRGCPANHDRDGDGVPDMIDRCPDLPGPASNQGCPEPQKPAVCEVPPPSTDLPLPMAPLVAATPAPAPVAKPDRDHDGVPDDEDNCPDEPGPVENHGCPAKVKQLVVINGTKIDILEKVYFASAKSVIDPRSFKLLDQVAQVLNSHPELSKIEVQGHTDNAGDPIKNEKLSQARAEAVVAYLKKKKVLADRLSAKGYGSAHPVVLNTSKAAREKNRRVEFHVLDVKARTVEAIGAHVAPADANAPVAPPMLDGGTSAPSPALPAIPDAGSPAAKPAPDAGTAAASPVIPPIPEIHPATTPASTPAAK